jgi:CHAT domain-containing protein/predicted negative regulator of RcsB-dependent stress response
VSSRAFAAKKGGVNMVRRNIVKIVFILLFFLGVCISSQDKQLNEDKDKKLREEILSVYQSKGEQGLRDFVKKEKEKITNKFIVDFAKAGLKERKEEWLKICEILAEAKKDEKTLAEVLFNIGEYYRLISEYKKATDYFDKALPIYLKLNNLVGQGNVHLSKGIIYHYTGENSKAFEMYDKALLFFEKAGDLFEQGNVYLRKGGIYHYSGENSKSLEMYDKALLFFEKTGALVGQGNVYQGKGNVYFYTGYISKASFMYDKALPFFEKAGDPYGQGNVYMGKGDIYYQAGDISQAIEMYDKALPFYEQAGDPFGQGNVYWSKGDIYFYIGEYSKSFEMYDKALPIFEKAEEPRGQGIVYLGKGDIYFYTGEYYKSFEMYNKALPFFQKAGQPLGQGNVYFSKGNIYLRIGDNSKALEMYDKALYFYENSKEPRGQGNVYLRKGEIYFNTGKNSKALDMSDKALSFFEKVGDILGQGDVYHFKGDICLRIGDNSKALEMYDNALPFFDKLGYPISQGSVYHGKGDIYLRIGNYSMALNMYEKAQRLYTKVREIEAESFVLYGKAQVLTKQDKRLEALALYEKAISYFEKVRELAAFRELKINLLRELYNKYEEVTLFMIYNKYYHKAYKYAEAIKSRVFIDQMAEGLVNLEKGLKPELRDKRDNLVAKLSNISKEMHETRDNEEKKLAELKEKYQKTQNEFEDLFIKIRIDNPLYASVRYPEPISVLSLQKEVLKNGEILVRYFITSDRVYVFLVSNKMFKVVPLEVKAGQIRYYVERFLKDLDTRDMEKYGKLLYRELFKPIESKLKGNLDIIIVPDSHLEKIPFESFIIGKAKSGRPIFLLEKYRIKYIQGASLFSLLRKYYQRDRETNNFIGFGDPVYDYDNFKQGQPEQVSMKTADEIKEIFHDRYARAGGLMNRLQGSGEEVKTIARLFENKSQKSLIYLREQASEDNAKASNLKEFDYIHFACHGILEDEFQCLALSQLQGDQSSEDGYFTLNEIMNCDYNAKLVVLSGCRTGSGKMERAEGVTGLTRAVMYAGTPSVIASLWVVDDPATKELMVTFYKNMLEKNLDKVEALRQAKLEMLKNTKYSSPLFWSAFVMYGE